MTTRYRLGSDNRLYRIENGKATLVERLSPLEARQQRQREEVERPDGSVPTGWEPTGTRHNPHWANND